MKVKIVKNEGYSVYVLDDDYGNMCDVPDAVLQRWDRVRKEFEKAQKELREFYLKGE